MLRGVHRDCAVLMFSLTVLLGQDAARNSRQKPATERPLVSVDVDLVQMDVVVTDARGNHITGLKPEDFEVLEGGKAQQVTNFSVLSREGGNLGKHGGD